MLAQVGSKLASCWLKLASCWPQVGLRANFGGKLELLQAQQTFKTIFFLRCFKLLDVCFKWLQVGSSCPHVVSSWPQFGLKLTSCCLKLAQTGLKLAQVGAKLVPSCSSWTQDQLRKPPGGSAEGSWEALGAKRPSWRPQRCQNGLQATPKSMKNR